MQYTKIAILGAECSGKSTLTKKLAVYYKASAAFEYLRHYCNLYKIPTTVNEQYHIAQQQIYIEKYLSYTKRNSKFHSTNSIKIIFCDTTPLLTYVYSLFYLRNIYTNYQLDKLKYLALNHQQTYKQTLLLQPNINWHYDKLRDGIAARWQIYELLERLLIQHNIKFTYVSLLKDTIKDIIIYV